MVTKKYSEINGELRKCNKTINEQSIEIESLRNDLATERQRCKDINFANQTLLKQKDIAKREAKSNDENVRASTPYSQRTVATCTTEDEKILNPIDEEIVKFTVFRRETSFSLALADRVLKFKDIGCNTNEDELEDVMISKDTYKFLKDRAIMLDDIDYLTISPAYNLDQTV